jgi:hypothetical protein
VIIAREFGRGAQTDGFFAAYGLFIVIVLVATGLRPVVLPWLARAQAEGRLGAEVEAWALVLAVLAVPALVLGLAAADWTASLLTGGLPDVARQAAGSVLPWMLPAAVCQVYAALAASALAALDDYATAALAYAVGSVSGLALILWRVGEDGVVAVAWGMFVNGALTLSILAVVLTLRGSSASGTMPSGIGSRLLELWRGVALALVLQALYVVCLRFAAELGVGAVTSFSYAYLIGAALVAVTASSLSLVSSVPLTRLGIDERGRAAAHVVNTSWLALAVVAGAAGVFALAGQAVAEGVLGGAYGGDAGTQLGRLVVELAPWMVASIGVSTTFPLLFVAGRARRLPWLAGAALVVHVPVVWAGKALFDLAGIAAALAVTNAVVLAGLLLMLAGGALASVAEGLAVATVWSGGLAAAAFAVVGLALPAIPAAALGLVVYAVLLVLLRPRGLVRAWSYVRALG